ncbi:MAG TPA: hypothetical protein VEA99_06045, partial [Gemmatimonadaceae bacterium]|nr:hypothetical protein [Gemmatimonadaceae bacterium]
MTDRSLVSIASWTLMLALIGGGELPAQVALRPAGAALARDDSLAMLRHARRAQRAFEVARRGRLPVVASRPSGGCDLQVGRFCYWHDDGDRPPKGEPREIGRARDRLLASLDSAATRSPGDEWIAGQRVRYHVEASDHAHALAAARDCRAAAWWCSALAGLVLHLGEQPVAADSAYREALARMPLEERCRWSDVSLFLDGAAAEAWKRAPCEANGAPARDSIANRLWWLARPFLARPTNDRYTEHLARRTMSRLESMATAGYDSRWGKDTEELILRFGWPTAWGRHLPPMGSTASPSIVGWEPTPSFHFLPETPPLGVLRDARWLPTRRDAPERY